MDRDKKSFFLREISDFKYMISLKRIFFSPRNLLYFPSLPSARKRDLLRRWRDERMRYLFENARDYDFMIDQEIDDLQNSVKLAKAVLSAEEESAIRIFLIQRTKKDEEAL